TATQSINGQPVDSANFYQFNPYIDELTYDQAMYTNLVSAGFPSTIGMLIDTSRDGWGGPNRPTGPSTSTDLNTFVNQSKIDERPFRGDWCNQNNAGLGPFPQANPNSSFTHLYAYVWIKPPGESDGDYPSGSHTHGDPHCDPNGTNTDGSGNTYSTGSIPGFDVPAGQWFPAEFQMLVHDAGDEQVALRLDDGPDPDAAVAAALRGPAWQAWSGFQAGPGTPFDDLDLWLATALPGYAVLAATRQARDRGIVASSSPVGISAGQAGSARPGGTGQARPVRLRTAGPAADGRSGCDGSGNPSGRRGPAARWIPESTPVFRDGSGYPSRGSGSPGAMDPAIHRRHAAPPG